MPTLIPVPGPSSPWVLIEPGLYLDVPSQVAQDFAAMVAARLVASRGA